MWISEVSIYFYFKQYYYFCPCTLQSAPVTDVLISVNPGLPTENNKIFLSPESEFSTDVQSSVVDSKLFMPAEAEVSADVQSAVEQPLEVTVKQEIGKRIFRTGFSILSAKGFRWVGVSEKPVRKDCRISKTRPLKKLES